MNGVLFEFTPPHFGLLRFVVSYVLRGSTLTLHAKVPLYKSKQEWGLEKIPTLA